MTFTYQVVIALDGELQDIWTNSIEYATSMYELAISKELPASLRVC